MKVQIKNRPSGAYNGEPWPEKGETIDLPEHIAEGLLATGIVIKPTTSEAKEDAAEAEAKAKAEAEAEAAKAKAEAEAEKAKKAAEAAEAKAAAVAAAGTGTVETAAVKTTPKK